jgi:hypothetical protein
MRSLFARAGNRSFLSKSLSLLLIAAFWAAPLCSQRPVAEAQRAPELTFDTLLSADSYKLYGEVRNVGQLLNAGGAGEIVEPIIKLADPPPQFKSILKFLKTNSEALLTSRLLFATWPARTELPSVFVAIEFPTSEEATKFAPKLETFLPTVLPPVPVEPEAKKPDEKRQQPATGTTAPPAKQTPAKPASAPQAAGERLPFVVSHRGNLVFMSDKSFKFPKLRPAGSKALTQDQNFRIARDQFSAESIFMFFNVALEDKTKAKPSPTPLTAEAEAQQLKRQEPEEGEPENTAKSTSTPAVEPNPVVEERAVLTAIPPPTPAPTPTKAQQAQQVASSQVGHLLDAIGYGEPQWPAAVGVAIALDGHEYVVRAILIDEPGAKKTPLPFMPQLISGPPFTTEAAAVLPEDTDVLLSVSIDLAQTHDGMRREAELRTKAEARARASQNGNAVPTGANEPPLDAFAAFEMKAGFKIKDDLLPALGNEIAIAGSLKSLQEVTGIRIAGAPAPKPSPQTEEEMKAQKESEGQAVPILLVAIKDREAARRLMPRVLNGLGAGEANLIAQVEKREDTELVNYAGIFAYAFVGDYLVVSEAARVRRVIDAYLNHRTLASNTVYRNSRRWQSNKTLGQIYVSPALMEGYQDQIRAQSANMDPELRDFMLSLDPNSSAITYALSNDGLGNQHEIHLPKNLILAMVAGLSSATKNPPPEMNEAFAASTLRMIHSSEGTYKSAMGKGSYGTLDKLVEEKLISSDMLEKYGYKFEVTVNGDQFEAIAVPREYGRTGKRSFFIDQSGVIRGDDHGGSPATAADKPLDQDF